MISKELIEANSVVYSETFGLDLHSDPFPWFLLSVLFGARITESIAIRTFVLFRYEKLVTPESLIKAGFDGLVSVLDSGGYTRYDFRTAVKLDEMSKNILRDGGLEAIHDIAQDPEDLISKLKNLAKGIGEVTVGIFMREMIGVWPKARPYPSKAVKRAAAFLGMDLNSASDHYGVSYARVESFLVNVDRECIRRGKRSGFCDLVTGNGK